MILYIILGILGFVILLFLESFSLSLFGISILFLLVLFLYKKIDAKILLGGSFFVTLFLDVVLNIPLGGTFFSFLLALLFYYLLSIFFTLESGFFSYIFKFLTLLFFYIGKYLLERVSLFSDLGYIDMNMLLAFLLKSFVGLVLLMFFDCIWKRLRGKGKEGGLKFK